MKTIFLTLTMVLLLITNPIWAYTIPYISIHTVLHEANNHTGGEKMMADLEILVKNSLLKTFPCASIMTQTDIRTLLQKEHDKELLGHYWEDDTFLEGHDERQKILDRDQAGHREHILKAVNSHYYIIIKIIGVGKTTIINLLFKNRQTDKDDIFISHETKDGSVGSSQIKAMVDELTKKMAFLEICPYTGSVNITVQSSKKKKSITEQEMFCN
ncbi:MAG: hypothetical protein ABIJ31_05120, partial [Pseudomonadota bacterium]